MNSSRELIDDYIGGLEFITDAKSKRRDKRVTQKILIDAASTALEEPFSRTSFRSFVLTAAEVGIISKDFGFSPHVNPVVLVDHISNGILINSVQIGLIEDIGRDSFVRCA
jgi:hypothetical protein